MDEILNAQEVATLLKLHRRTVYNLAEQGIIPGNKVGMQWRFSRVKILALVNNKKPDTELDNGK